MTTVRQLLQGKGYDIWSIGPDTLVIDALKLMAEKGIGALLVLEEEDLVGIISERDYARKVALQGKSSLNTPVKDIMTREVYCVGPGQTVEECMALMTKQHIRHLPVLSRNKLRGLVSIGDIVKAVISKQKFMIEQLEKYIVTSSS
jgi:CBS domain-containing protein